MLNSLKALGALSFVLFSLGGEVLGAKELNFSPQEQGIYKDLQSWHETVQFGYEIDEEIGTAIGMVQAGETSEEVKRVLGEYWNTKVRPRYDEILRDIDSLPESYEKAYLRAFSYMSRAKFFSDLYPSPSRIKEQLDKASESIKEAVKGKSPDTYLLQGQIYSLYLRVNPGMAIFYAGRAKGSFESALKRNKDNGRALHELGVWYFYAPSIAGGGTDKALRFIKDGRKNMDSRLDLFDSHLWEAIFLGNKGEFSEGLKAVERALEIAPNNGLALLTKGKLEEGLDPLP